jgi:hypothetical protein
LSSLSYLRDDCRKQAILIFESHDDSNQCTPYRGKPDQHDMYASHASSHTPGVRFLWVVPIHGNLSQVIERVEQGHCSREKGLPTQSTARQLIQGFIPSFSPEPTLKQWGQSQPSINDKLLGLLGPYHQHAISTFNVCSQGPTHLSLTDTGEVYHIETLESP